VGFSLSFGAGLAVRRTTVSMNASHPAVQFGLRPGQEEAFQQLLTLIENLEPDSPAMQAYKQRHFNDSRLKEKGLKALRHYEATMNAVGMLALVERLRATPQSQGVFLASTLWQQYVEEVTPGSAG
jgi:hypothetical protein